VIGSRSAAPAGISLPLACGACLLAGGAYIAAVDPSDGGGLTACPIRSTTGRWCPGCGLTRATHHLLRGDVAQALSFNLMIPLVLIAFVVMWWTWFRVSAGRGVSRWVGSIGRWTVAAAGVSTIAFTVLRNLPGWEWLRGGL
jgi:hypothetical protein